MCRHEQTEEGMEQAGAKALGQGAQEQVQEN